MSVWSFRLAEPADAEAFACWVAENPQIDPADIQAGLKKNNPTAVMFVVEKDGKVVSFAPLYCQMALAHLGFNPEALGSDRLESLNVMLDGVMAFAVQFGVREIVTLTDRKYPIAKWAEFKGFVPDGRQLFKFDINSVLKQAEPEVEQKA